MNWSNQLWTTLAEKSLHAAAFAVLSILMLQAVYAERPISGSNPKGDFILGAGLASLFAALNAFISLTFPSHETPAIITADLASYVPWLSTTINALKDIDYVIAAIVLAIGILRFSQTRIRFTLLAVLALVWSICSGFAAKEIGLEIAHNVIILLAMAIIVFLVNRKQVGVAIGMAGVYLALQRADIAYALYASAWLHAVIATIITAAITYALVWHWHRNAR